MIKPSDRAKLIASIAPLKAVLDSRAAKENEALRRSVKAALKHATREIKKNE